ncbi:hypothetical protein OAU96_01180 [Planctomycetota bacterium]|nr:hypothetical protein [Planctomycetota bacterium]
MVPEVTGDLFAQKNKYGRGIVCSDRDLLQLLSCGFLMAADGSEYQGRLIQDSFTIVEPGKSEAPFSVSDSSDDRYDRVYLEVKKSWKPESGVLCCSDVSKQHFTTREMRAEFAGTYLAGESPVLDLFPEELNLDWNQILKADSGEKFDKETAASPAENRELSRTLEILGGGLFSVFNTAVKHQVSPEFLEILWSLMVPMGLKGVQDFLPRFLRKLSTRLDEDLDIDLADHQYLENCVGEIVRDCSGQKLGGRQFYSDLCDRVQSRSEDFQRLFKSKLESESEAGIKRFQDSYGQSVLIGALGILTGDQDVGRLTELFGFEKENRPGPIAHSLALFLAGCLSGSMLVSKTNLDRDLMLSLSKGLVETRNKRKTKKSSTKGSDLELRQMYLGQIFELRVGDHVYSTLPSGLSGSFFRILDKLEDRKIPYEVTNPKKVCIKEKHISEVMGFGQEGCFGDVSLISTKEGLFASGVYQPKEKFNWTVDTKNAFTEFLARQGLQRGVVFKPLIAEAARPPLKVQVSVFVENPSGGIQASISKLGVEIAKLYHVSWKKKN